jgi:hypothetical protein
MGALFVVTEVVAGVALPNANDGWFGGGPMAVESVGASAGFSFSLCTLSIRSKGKKSSFVETTASMWNGLSPSRREALWTNVSLK